MRLLPPMPRKRFPYRPTRRAAVAAAVAFGAAALAHAPSSRAAAWASNRVIVGYRASGRGLRGISARPDIAVGEQRWADVAVDARPHVTSHVVRLPAHESVAAALTRLRRRHDVAYAEPDYIAHASGMFYPDDRGEGNTAHGWERQQWNMLPGAGVDAPEAWANLIADGRAGGSGVKIAVLDSGIAYRNWMQFRESPDLHQTKFVDPYDFIAHNRYPLDRYGHGTFVASIIAESTNNRIGLTGLAYGASIMPVRVLDAQGNGDESTIAQGIRYAVAHHANIINLSLEFLPNQVTSATQIPQLVSAVRYARRHNVMIVAASGNDETQRISYPARLSGVVAVGATTKDECLASYSNTGTGLALVAPGGGSDAILRGDSACHPERALPSISQMTLTDPPHWGKFGYPSAIVGTSMAAPAVAAAAALVIASGVIGPTPTPSQVLQRLETTATALPVGGPQPNTTYGWGLLNAGAATSPLAIPAR
jgi:serine protease